jgi:predicted alpha/beta hydrolase family esterase
MLRKMGCNGILNKSSGLPRQDRRLWKNSILWIALGAWSLGTGCNIHLPYTASEIASFEGREFGDELTYQTRAGRQNAFYVPPKDGPERAPERLVIMYPGFLLRALDWLEIVDHAPDPKAGFLLIDYPGRGKCEGSVRPKHLLDSSFGAIEALGLHLNVRQDELTKHLCLLGHSFGCAAALQFAPHVDVERIVLIAPFTTLHRAVYKLYGPLAWLIPDRMDNQERLRELCQRPRRPAVVIIHGSADDTLPVKMGRDLARLFPGWIVYHEIEGADHVGILKISESLIFKALFSLAPSAALPLSAVTDTASPTRFPDGETIF